MASSEACKSKGHVQDEPVRLGPAEKRLAEQFAAGDRAAAEQVIAMYAPRITRLAQRMLGWRSDVGDIVQDTFVAALASRARFRGDSRLETWLMRIAINRCRAFHRRRLLRDKLFGAWYAESVTQSDRDRHATKVDPIRNGESPEESAMAMERAAVVRAAIAKLPTKYREVVVLFYLEEMNARDAAESLRLKPNTVEVRLSRARKILGELLAPLTDAIR